MAQGSRGTLRFPSNPPLSVGQRLQYLWHAAFGSLTATSTLGAGGVGAAMTMYALMAGWSGWVIPALLLFDAALLGAAGLTIMQRYNALTRQAITDATPDNVF